MSSIHRSRHARTVSLVVVCCMVLPLLPWVTPGAQAQPAGRTVLLFPIADESSSGLIGLSKMATEALQKAVDTLPGYECTEFSRTSPLVRRAASEGRVLPTQIEAATVTPREAVAIGYALNVDSVIVASIQSYRSSLSPRSVEVILSGRSYDVKPNYNIDADEARPSEELTISQGFGVVGTSRKLPGYQGASERMLAREAVADAAARAAQVLSGASISDISKPTPPPKKKNTAMRTLGILAVIGLLAWAVSSSGGDSDLGPSPEARPPRTLPLGVEGTDTIRVSWEPPSGTSLTVLRYQLQRSVGGGAWTYFGVGAGSSSIPAGTTQFPDFEVTSGTSYAYRIRAVYTNSKVSEWAYFSGVTL